ncbi:DedA family protein [Christensenella intestinihominis]|uniref:DedA family protein n=1 Tax=Christensenella intestinihominis TaxID=1851429 RepID=UPI00082FF0A8|nr:DedA family protein [Christensenella intestinihominis]
MDWIVTLMDRFGYLGIAALIAVENIFPPIPSEVVLTFGGFMTTYSSLGVWGVVLAATAGSVAGALVLYWVGRLLNAERLEKWLGGKLGRILHLRPDDVEKACVWFEKRGGKAVFLCRFIPIVRSLISIPAGMTRMNVPKFLALSAAGTFLWNLVLVNLGAFMGASWEKIADAIGVYASVVLVAIAAAFLTAAFLFYKKRLAKKKRRCEGKPH